MNTAMKDPHKVVRRKPSKPQDLLVTLIKVRGRY